MRTSKFKNKLVLGLGALALTFGGFASLYSPSTKTISKSAFSSNHLVKDKSLKSAYNYSAYYPICPKGSRGYPYPVSRCLKNTNTPPVFYPENYLENIEERLEKANRDAEEIEEMLQKTEEILEKIRDNWKGRDKKS